MSILLSLPLVAKRSALHRSGWWRWCVCAALVWSSPGWAGNYTVRVETNERRDSAVDLDIRQLLEQHLDIVRYRNREDIRDEYLEFLLDNAVEQARTLLATKGYFKATVRIKNRRTGQWVGADEQNEATNITYPQLPQIIEEQSNGVNDAPSYSVVVFLGQPAVVKSAELTTQGLMNQEDVKRADTLTFDWSLQEDEVFSQTEWAMAKTLLLRKVRADAYAGAKFVATRAMVSADRTRVQVSATLDSGPYFTLGDVQIRGLQKYDPSIIINMNTIEVGESYNRAKLLAYQKALQDLPYFSNVTVDIDANTADAQLTPIKVFVSELPTSYFRGLVGYGTDAGYRANAQYSYYNLFNQGWIYDVRYDWQQKERLAQTSLSTPQNKYHYQWSIYGKLDEDETSSVRDNTYQIGLRYGRKLDTSSLAYHVDYYRSLLGDYRSHASVLGLTWSRFSVDSRAYPRRGYALEAALGGAAKSYKSSSDFVRAYTRLRWFVPIAKKDVLLLRAEIGAVKSNDLNTDIPSGLLFKAGGSGSVRGYGYNTIGANVYSDKVLPAKYMATMSAEYTHWYADNWGWAVFYDAASVTDDWRERPWYYGVGVGTRWRSPVGPIQFDIAYGMPRKKFTPHLSIGLVF